MRQEMEGCEKGSIGVDIIAETVVVKMLMYWHAMVEWNNEIVRRRASTDGIKATLLLIPAQR